MRTTLELSYQYRITWEEFVRATNALQDSLAAAAPDRARAEVALFEAERARLAYNAARDLLVAQLAGLRASANIPSQTLPQDWLHAERLVQSASATIAR
jgi:hypothetical protein